MATVGATGAAEPGIGRAIASIVPSDVVLRRVELVIEPVAAGMVALVPLSLS